MNQRVEHRVECDWCFGKGLIELPSNKNSEIIEFVDCLDCDGQGYHIDVFED